MAFIQKDRHSRKDKVNQAGAAPDPHRPPRVVIHRNKDGQSHVHLDIPEGAGASEAHLDALLDRVQARRAEEEAQED